MNRPKPFSIIRQSYLADWFTLANAFYDMCLSFAAKALLQPREVMHT